jgi:hypothetical protein
MSRLPERAKGSRAEWKMQSIRLLAADNRKMKKIARAEGLTFNRWAVDTLLKEVKRKERANAKVQSDDKLGAV